MLYLGKTGQWQFSAKNLARRKSQRRCGIQSPHTVREKSKLSDFLKRKENGCFLPMPKGRGIRSLVFDDSQIIDALTDIFDKEELDELGYADFIKDYFAGD